MLSCRLSILSTAIMAFGVSGWAQEDASSQPIEVSLTSDIPINDNSLERILRIRKIVGTFRLREDVRSASLRLDLYRNGRPVAVKMTKPGVGGKSRRHGQFLVQIVDLDYLKLGDAPPGHWRIFASLMMTDTPNGRGVMAGPQQMDVPKAQFDAQASTSMSGRFTEFPDGPVREIPVFFSASGRIQKHSSLAELLREHPESDVLVGVLELR